MMKSHLQLARQLTTLMDTKFTFFGLRFGLDPILSIWPGFGSFVGAVVSCYLFWIAYTLKVPFYIYVRMGWNILIDFLFGSIPLVGFVVDIFFRANTKNLALLAPFSDPEILEGVIED